MIQHHLSTDQSCRGLTMSNDLFFDLFVVVKQTVVCELEIISHSDQGQVVGSDIAVLECPLLLVTVIQGIHSWQATFVFHATYQLYHFLVVWKSHLYPVNVVIVCVLLYDLVKTDHTE